MTNKEKKKKKTTPIIYILNNFEIDFATFIMIVITILLFLQVITRYVFRYALAWTEEASIILFVWVIYLGISACTKEGGHIRIDVLPNALKPKARKYLLLFTDLVFLAFCIYIIRPLITVMQAQGSSTSVMLGIPMKLAYGIIPFGMALTAIRTIQSFVRNFKQQTAEPAAGKLDSSDSSAVKER